MEDINKTNDEIEIDISALMKLLKKNIKMIVICTVLGAVIAFLVTNFFMTKKYASSARIYLIPKVTEQGYADYNAVNSNSKMVNNYVSLMQGETILSKVADELNIENVEEVKNSLSITNVNETEIIDV
ncbi:Wzz/FepE/Etk N-terminal domain-containing protein, partial [[Eubacterium] hominis]